MQNNAQYTRCPQCQTAFKVTPKMLSMAHGKVRCGACLTVFQATEHILKPRSKPTPAQAAEPEPAASAPEAPVEVKEKTVEEADTHELASAKAASLESSGITPAQAEAGIEAAGYREPALGDLNDVADELDDMALDTSRADTVEVESVVADKRSEPESGFDDSETASFDESQETAGQQDEALSSLSGSAETEDEITSSSDVENGAVEPEVGNWQMPEEDDLGLTTEAEASALDLDFEPLSAGSDDAASLAQPEEHGLQEQEQEQELEIDDILAMAENALDASEPADNDGAQTITQETDSSLVERAEIAAGELDEFEVGGQEIDAEATDDFGSQQVELETEESAEWDDEGSQINEEPDFGDIDNIDNGQLADTEIDGLSQNLAGQINEADTSPDPLDEFEGRVQKKKTGLRNLVIYGSVTVILVLIGHTFWKNRQTLAYDETWGGVTKSICSLLPCDLQPRRDIANIRTLQRIVTPSESEENQLDIKILLVNQAEFAQPYPDILIKFSNSQGQQVAQKQFSVADYNPDWQGQMMPAGAEIHISFNTELPHPDALGFEILFQ